MRIPLTLLCCFITQAAFAANKIDYPALNWKGVYLGVHLGSGLGQAHFSDPFGPSIFGDLVRTPIFLGGGQVGYNWKLGRTPWLFGIETSASDLLSEGTFTGNAFSGFYISQNCRVRPKIIATITGRVGTVMGPKGECLLYLKGGPAWIHNKADLVTNGFLPVPVLTTSTTYSKWGTTLGGGMEYALTPAWSVGLEYDYLQFSDVSIPIPASFFLDIFSTELSVKVLEGAKSNMAQHLHLFKMNLNYKFGMYPCKDWNVFNLRACKEYLNEDHNWNFKLGMRKWFGEGRFQKDLGVNNDPLQANSLISRLTYATHNNTNEIFWRLESPCNMFFKGFASVGNNHLHGKMNDEDWLPLEFLMYSNTTHQVRGNLSYFTIDEGYDFVRHCDRKFGLYVGYNYYHENNTAFGCAQIANPFGPCVEPIPTSVPAITENVKWNSCRIGLNGEIEIYPRLTLAGDIAYLTCAHFSGQDVHRLRMEVPNQNSFEYGTGYGVQTEVSLSYLITRHLSIGIGGRYVAMWTHLDAFADLFGGQYWQTLESKTERYGAFLQAIMTL